MWISVTPTNIPDVKIIQPQMHWDARWFFVETYNERKLQDAWIKAKFIQDNLSRSTRWVARWFHLQTIDNQAKLVRAAAWRILDMAIDLRKHSDTYKQIVSVILSASKQNQFYIPRWFWHAFISLEDGTELAYKVDNVYNPTHDTWISMLDPELPIDWQAIEIMHWIKKDELILSEKDQKLPTLAEFQKVHFWHN